MLSICVDEQGRITSLCPDDLTGTSGWQLATKKFNLTINDNIFDGHGAALYSLVNGKAVDRPEEERQNEWIEERVEEPMEVPSEITELAEAARILFGEAT